MRTRDADVVTLLSAASGGIVVGASGVLMAISFAALVFSGPLEAFMGPGVGAFLFGTVVTGLVIALRSAFPHAVAAAQDVTAAIMGVAAAAVAAALPPRSAAVLPTVASALAVTTVATAAVFVLLGAFRMANLVRYVPYPVVGGFLAGTGWLLVDGAMGVVAGRGISVGALPVLLGTDVLARWLPALGLGLLVLVVLRRGTRPLALPALLFGAAALFHLALRVGGTSVTAARAGGWLLGPFPEGALWRPVTGTVLQEARWDIIAGQGGTLATVVVIGVLAFLLNATGLELAAGRDVDLNRELTVVGAANAVSGLGGGPVGFHALSLSALSRRASPAGRVTGLVVVAVYGVALLGGTTVLALLPTFLPGAVLFFLGLDFLVTWLWDVRTRLSRSEHAIVAVIAVAMAGVGVLEGVALGILLAMLLFVLEYGRGDPVRRTLSGRTHRSNVDRPPTERRVLHEHGDQLRVLELQRFIFFGTANRLLEAVRRHVVDDGQPPRFVLLDFRSVTGIDASAGASFAKIGQLAERHGFDLVLTGLSPGMRRHLGAAGFSEDGGPSWRILPDLDHGTEWCEAQILRDALPADAADDGDVTAAALAPLLAHIEVRALAAGTRLIEAGQPPTGLYYLRAGQLTAQLDRPDGRVVRLRRMRPGVFVGELSLYAGARASASVVADEPSEVLHLSTEALARLEREDPAAAAAFHRHIAGLASQRLLEATATMSALL